MQVDPSVDTIKCTYKRGVTDPKENPHNSEPFVPYKKIYDDVLDAIGHTPMIRLNKIPKTYGVKCEVLVKCEFMNPGGSLKDRIGMRMVLDAEKSGRLKKGNVLIEATSGNTGVGMAIAAAVKEYKLFITMPEKMSQEKEDVLTGLGAKVIRTPNDPWYAPTSLIGVAKRMVEEDPNIVLLDQYSNPSNPMAHYDATGEEILYQTDEKVTAVVISTGTGGALTGVARKVHERLPQCQIVAVDPYGSVLAQPQSLNVTDVQMYKVEGIGYDFIPRVLDREQVDHWVKVHDKESLHVARRLLSEEGLLCGGSSGSTVLGAMMWAQKQNLTENDRIVIVLADSIRNYMTKHLNKTWMIESGLYLYEELKEESHPLRDRPLNGLNLPEVQLYDIDNTTIEDCLKLFLDTSIVAIPFFQGDNKTKIYSVVFQKKLLKNIVDRNLNKASNASLAQTKDFVVVPSTLDQNQLERIVERHEVVFVQDQPKTYIATPRLLLSQFL